MLIGTGLGGGALVRVLGGLPVLPGLLARGVTVGLGGVRGPPRRSAISYRLRTSGLCSIAA